MEDLVEREFSGFLGQGQNSDNSTEAGQSDENKQRSATFHLQSFRTKPHLLSCSFYSHPDVSRHMDETRPTAYPLTGKFARRSTPITLLGRFANRRSVIERIGPLVHRHSSEMSLTVRGPVRPPSAETSNRSKRSLRQVDQEARVRSRSCRRSTRTRTCGTHLFDKTI
jgi:hypothetical protein